MVHNAQKKSTLVWDVERLRSPHEQADKAARVRQMFDAIAPKYELVNRVFSLGRDRAWRRRMVVAAKPVATDRLLDVACGTGDVVRMFLAAEAAPRSAIGCDFAGNMLTQASRRGPHRAEWVQGDALGLPFADGSFDIATCAFGVRNFGRLEVGLAEFYRVLAVGGRAVILEFTRPANPVLRLGYEWYCSKIMPIGASLISRDRTGAYRYLPSSVVSFHDAEGMKSCLRDAGFERVTATPMTLGIVTIYVGHKATS